MKNTTLTAVITRLAGFALFVKIFDFFGSYFISIYLTASMALMVEVDKISMPIDKLYVSGAALAFTNLFLSLFLILKSEWIARKLIKTETELHIEITTRGIMKIVIATIGIIYCARTLYILPTTIENSYSTIHNWSNPEHKYEHLMEIINYIISAFIGVLFIL